jgi:hypothetical protein
VTSSSSGMRKVSDKSQKDKSGSVRINNRDYDIVRIVTGGEARYKYIPYSDLRKAYIWIQGESFNDLNLFKSYLAVRYVTR